MDPVAADQRIAGDGNRVACDLVVKVRDNPATAFVEPLQPATRVDAVSTETVGSGSHQDAVQLSAMDAELRLSRDLRSDLGVPAR